MSKVEKNGTKKKGPWDRFMQWYESYKGKRAVGIIYSAGASVVIIGALFKILHWPGASTVLMIGMFTESFLFLIGTLDKPHPSFNWSNVFPQLLEEGGTDPAVFAAKATQPRPTLLGAGVDGGVAPTIGNSESLAAGQATTAMQSAAMGGVPKMPTFTDEDIATLEKGILDLAKTATQLSELGKVATATTQLSAKMEVASAVTEQFATSQEGLLATSMKLGEAYRVAENSMQKAAETTKGFAQDMESVGTKLSTLNAIYELQINTLQGQTELAKTQTNSLQQIASSLQSMEANAAEAKKSHEEYTAAVKKLTTQVADLNAIYGNMLNALA